MSPLRGLTAVSAMWLVLAAASGAAAEGDHPHPSADEAAAAPGPEATAAESSERPPARGELEEPLDGDTAQDVPPAAQPGAGAFPPPDDSHAGAYRSRRIPDTNWRQRARRGESSSSRYTDFSHFFFELRFGPYSPEVDEEFGGAATPYADFFDTDPQFYFGLEIDWRPLYLPYVVSIGPGFGWGVTSTSANTKLESDPNAEAESETGLTIFPMHLSAVARFDGPLREMNVPIVPYIKAGFGFGMWTISRPDGSADIEGTSPEGSSYGLHLAVGGSIALNAFDPSTAMAMREDTGIRYAYIYGEWMWTNLDGIGSTPQLHIGTSTAVFGLALEF